MMVAQVFHIFKLIIVVIVGDVMLTQDGCHMLTQTISGFVNTPSDLFAFTFQVDDYAIEAHRIVLASTIPYFHAMFTHEMAEAKQREVTIKHGVESSVMESLINFAYRFNDMISEYSRNKYHQQMNCFQWQDHH